MDYISGGPLDDYVTLTKPSIDDALRLFAKICDAVNAAHLRGVIHRDLKPSNIRIDADGEPHILDFGLAKIATGQVTNGTRPQVMTLTGQFFGSLPWASPEQAEAIPSKIDLRTDVYSLGVIFYQMMTGRFPYEVVGNIRDVMDRIMNTEPAKPSTIRRQINDEVETIVLKSLAKERDRRYQSAGELARDVWHYLAGEPIEAKRDSGWYVLKKSLRRYRVPVAVGGVFVVLLLTFAKTMSIQAKHNRALAEKEQAAKQAALVAERERALAIMREEELEILGSLTAVGDSEAADWAHAQSVVDRLADRILAGESTGEDRHRLALTLTRIQVRGRRLQARGQMEIGIHFGPIRRVRAKELGVLLTPRVFLDGQPTSWSHQRVLVGFTGGGCSCGVLITDTITRIGRHVLRGSVEARLVRLQGPICCASEPQQGEDYAEALGEPILLAVEQFALVVLDELPEGYPVSVTNRELAADFTQGVRIEPLLISANSSQEGFIGQLSVHFPDPPMYVPLRIHIRGRIRGVPWEGTQDIIKSPGWVTGGAGSPMVKGLCLSGNTVTLDLLLGGMGGSVQSLSTQELSCDVSIESCRELARAVPEITEYLNVQIARTVQVRIVEDIAP